MTRTDLWFLLAFLASVVVAVAVAFGNPLRLEGAKLQELLGYLFGLALSAAILFATVSFAVLRRPTRDEPNATHTHRPADSS